MVIEKAPRERQPSVDEKGNQWFRLSVQLAGSAAWAYLHISTSIIVRLELPNDLHFLLGGEAVVQSS